MTMFVSKVWGFDIPCGPMVFSSSGWMENAIKQIGKDDLVILVGTLGDPTPDADRNRVLGMMQPSTCRISTSDFPLPMRDEADGFRRDGRFRWPHGLLNYRAWKFELGLLLADAAPRAGNPFGSVAAAGIVKLTAEEQKRVLAHPHFEVPLIQSYSGNRKLYGLNEAKRRGAPMPTEGVRRGIMHMRSAPADLYWLKLVSDGKVRGRKIGWAFDARERAKQFNSVSMHQLGGLFYRLHARQDFGTARLAFRAEQTLLREFEHTRHPANREILTGLSTDKIQEAWERVLTEVRR